MHPRKYAVVVLLPRCVLPNATPKKKNHDINTGRCTRTYAVNNPSPGAFFTRRKREGKRERGGGAGCAPA